MKLSIVVIDPIVPVSNPNRLYRLVVSARHRAEEPELNEYDSYKAQRELMSTGRTTAMLRNIF